MKHIWRKVKERTLVPLGLKNDLVGYEVLINYLKKYSVSGDILEIGSFLGGGTKKLAKAFPSKTIHAVDIFDFSADKSIYKSKPLGSFYNKLVGRRDQKTVFYKNIDGLSNVEVYETDSKDLQISKPLCFSFIDGNHESDYVVSDFYTAWEKTASGGIICFHDYNGDFPDVTKKIEFLVDKHKDDIAKVQTVPSKLLLFLHKK